MCRPVQKNRRPLLRGSLLELTTRFRLRSVRVPIAKARRSASSPQMATLFGQLFHSRSGAANRGPRKPTGPCTPASAGSNAHGCFESLVPDRRRSQCKPPVVCLLEGLAGRALRLGQFWNPTREPLQPPPVQCGNRALSPGNPPDRQSGARHPSNSEPHHRCDTTGYQSH